MRILRYSLTVLVLILLLQATFTALVLSYGTPKTLDTNDSRKTIFQTDSKMAVYASPIITRNSGKLHVVILGSSNTTMGLRPDKLQPYLGDTPIHNLSIGSEKFRAIGQTVDLLYRQTPPENRKNYVFVIGLSYPLIADTPDERASQTSVDDEVQRFGLFAKTEQGSAPRIADGRIANALRYTWPFLMPKALYNSIIRVLPEPLWFGLAEPVPFTAEESNAAVYNKDQLQERIDHYNAEIIDATGEHTFDPLLKTIERITASGGHVVIVDLPSAQWLQRATPLYAAYQTLRKPYISRLERMPHVRYINAEQGFSDADFYDGIHPRNRITGDIAKRIAPAIQQALKDIP